MVWMTERNDLLRALEVYAATSLVTLICLLRMELQLAEPTTPC